MQDWDRAFPRTAISLDLLRTPYHLPLPQVEINPFPITGSLRQSPDESELSKGREGQCPAQPTPKILQAKETSDKGAKARGEQDPGAHTHHDWKQRWQFQHLQNEAQRVRSPLQRNQL